MPTGESEVRLLGDSNRVLNVIAVFGDIRRGLFS
jgi:hypothetical protein